MMREKPLVPYPAQFEGTQVGSPSVRPGGEASPRCEEQQCHCWPYSHKPDRLDLSAIAWEGWNGLTREQGARNSTGASAWKSCPGRFLGHHNEPSKTPNDFAVVNGFGLECSGPKG